MSRTINEKFKFLSTEGQTSQVFAVEPAKTVVKSGKYLLFEVVEVNVLKLGPAALVGVGAVSTAPGLSGSFCSQLYVIALLSGSVPCPVNTKAVDLGIT